MLLVGVKNLREEVQNLKVQSMQFTNEDTLRGPIDVLLKHGPQR